MEGKYLYGVIKEEKERDFGPIGIGEHQDSVYTIPHQGLSAVVSDSPRIAYDSIPKEAVVRHLANHQFVIEQVMKSHTIIPVKFGTLAEGEEEVRRILEKGYAQFSAALDEMSDKIELDVVATWSNLDSILKEIGEEEKVRKFREEAAARRPSELYEAARLEMGKLVKSALDDRRENTASEIVDALREASIDYWPHEVMDDNMIMNVAFLIGRDKEKGFDEKVNQLDERYQDRVNFRCVGPLPPYSFNTMEVKRMDFAVVNDARNVLGLGEEATITEIKDAHRWLAQELHPDQHPGDPEAQKQFEQLTKAYRVLTDYCQEGRCSFREEDVKNSILVRVLEL